MRTTIPERIYVVANRGTTVVFFDDVEEEFATGVMDSGGTVSQPSLFGELRWALASLDSPGNSGNSVWPAEPLA